jgi:hypothetical protein
MILRDFDGGLQSYSYLAAGMTDVNVNPRLFPREEEEALRKMLWAP